MRRRRFVLAVAAGLGGCSARRDDGTGSPSPSDGRTPGHRGASGTPTGTPNGSPTPTPRATEGDADVEAVVESVREHLAVAFDELRAMRPVGSDAIHVSEARFGASDHGIVRERVAAAEAALDGAGAVDGPGPAPLPALRAAVDLARAGRELYDAVRVGIRAEWRFERRCYDARWAAARDDARRAAEAVGAWERHGEAVTGAVESVEAAGSPSVPRLSLRGWFRDGAVLASVSGPWTDVLEGFRSFAEAVRLDEAGLGAMDADEYRRAGDRFSAALTSVREAHRRLARAKAEGAQGFQAYALPIRRRCDPFRRAYETQVEAARAAADGETDRAETLASRAMERIVTAELEHPLPTPEGGTPEGGSGTG